MSPLVEADDWAGRFAPSEAGPSNDGHPRDPYPLDTGGLMNVLANPVRGSTGRPPPSPGIEAAFDGGVARWSLFERKLLSPARQVAVECLVRLRRADGMKPDWRPGDLIELCGPLDHVGMALESAPPFTFGPRHGAVSLLPGGWPMPMSGVQPTSGRTSLPIASSAETGILDILVFTGSDARPVLDSETSRRLLWEPALDMRILRSSERRIPGGPCLFIGDRSTVGIARAFLQGEKSDRCLFLIESERDDTTLLSAAMFPPSTWRAGRVRTMPKLAGGDILVRILEAHRHQTESLAGGVGSIVIAASSENFLATVRDGLNAFFGAEEVAGLDAAGRLRRIALS